MTDRIEFERDGERQVLLVWDRAKADYLAAIRNATPDDLRTAGYQLWQPPSSFIPELNRIDAALGLPETSDWPETADAVEKLKAELDAGLLRIQELETSLREIVDARGRDGVVIGELHTKLAAAESTINENNAGFDRISEGLRKEKRDLAEQLAAEEKRAETAERERDAMKPVVNACGSLIQGCMTSLDAIPIWRAWEAFKFGPDWPHTAQPPAPAPHVISTKGGHQWVRSEGIWLECQVCSERWPQHGDLAPMPACSTPILSQNSAIFRPANPGENAPTLEERVARIERYLTL